MLALQNLAQHPETWRRWNSATVKLRHKHDGTVATFALRTWADIVVHVKTPKAGMPSCLRRAFFQVRLGYR